MCSNCVKRLKVECGLLSAANLFDWDIPEDEKPILQSNRVITLDGMVREVPLTPVVAKEEVASASSTTTAAVTPAVSQLVPQPPPPPPVISLQLPENVEAANQVNNVVENEGEGAWGGCNNVIANIGKFKGFVQK